MKQAVACLLIFLTSGLSLAAHHRQATTDRNPAFTGVNIINTTGAPLQTGGKLAGPRLVIGSPIIGQTPISASAARE